MFEQSDTPGQSQHTWGPVLPNLSQQQCSPLDSTSAGGWSSIDLTSFSAEDFPTNQFFHESYHGNDAPQPFCSPTTPGPSPHHPQTHPRTERTGSQTQTSSHLNREPTLNCSLNEIESYFLASDMGQQHPHQASQCLLLSQTNHREELTGLLKTVSSSEASFPPQGRGGSGPTCREECGRGGRKGRHGQPDLTWVKQMQHEGCSEVPGSRLMCTVCKRDFRSLPALNGHMRSHSGFRSPTLVKKDLSPVVQNPVAMVMPVSVPVKKRWMSSARGGGQKRGKALPLAPRGRALYCSLMHTEEREAVATSNKIGEVVTTADGGRYAPPPMLCPRRAGSGLYCSLATKRQQIVQTVQLHNELGDPAVMATSCPGTLTSGIIKPRINLGQRFQAEIPPLRDRKRACSDSHDAALLWTPWDKLECPINQQRVEALLMMARSSVLLGGGTSQEYALQILSECRGDFLVKSQAVEKLLLQTSSSNPTGVRWSAAEKQLLVKSLQLHKDFSSVQEAVQTKSRSECVEFYYLWKKKLSLRTPAGLTVTLPQSNGQRLSKSQKAS
ncbi:transcriptional-regulating factor 1-like [Leuresthes tenuis]|uniref:transcriptional-regulating factor 1-like n=1 Tax=Leuresthes tenuis TaxID=355514 RepID=UPI003B5049B5